jgi:hypothetical protein
MAGNHMTLLERLPQRANKVNRALSIAGLIGLIILGTAACAASPPTSSSLNAQAVASTRSQGVCGVQEEFWRSFNGLDAES